VRCWNDSSSIYIVITDNCPCIQTNATTGAVAGVNPPCCGDIYHMCAASPLSCQHTFSTRLQALARTQADPDSCHCAFLASLEAHYVCTVAAPTSFSLLASLPALDRRE
jgi:hypothetical protein